MSVSEYADFSIKARCGDLTLIHQILSSLGARYVGEDLQTDTYFQVSVGKMKLREGSIERLLTHYLREEDRNGQMKTTVFLYERDPSRQFILEHTGGLKRAGTVVKNRRIYFIDNVKFHLDRLTANGGTFVEIEAIDREGQLGAPTIRKQAEKYRDLLRIRQDEILKDSYIDMQP